MNRPMKFRVWDGVKMWSGISLTNMLVYDNMHQWFSEKDVMQFTGLLDRNDKEIYEGDILRTFVRGKEVIAPMVWNRSLAQFGLDASVYFKTKDHEVVHVRTNDERPEILGNIFENPELMKV